MNSLQDNGYIILRNKLSENQINSFLTFVNDDNSVNYNIVKNFIDNKFLNVIQQDIDLFNNPYYLKFRFSNNNNSTDAATFHSDVYNFIRK